MLVLFCSSVLLKEHDFIPADEIIFYVFAAVGSPPLPSGTRRQYYAYRGSTTDN